MPLGALAGLIGTGANIANQRDLFNRQLEENARAAERNFSYNEQSAQNAYNRQLQAWHLQNAYNTPRAEVARLKAAGLSPGLMYGSGTAGVSNAGGLSSAAQGAGTQGIGPVDMSSIANARTSAIGKLLEAMQLRKQESEIAVNESVRDRNYAEAGLKHGETSLIDDRRDLMQSQALLNGMLGLNAQARTAGEVLSNELKQLTLPYNYNLARQQVMKNEQDLMFNTVNLNKAILSLQFDRDTYDDRVAMAASQQREYVARIAVQEAQVEAIRKGMKLTDAQIEQTYQNVKTQIEMERYIGERAGREKVARMVDEKSYMADVHRRFAQSNQARYDAAYRRNELNWFKPDKVRSYIESYGKLATSFMNAQANVIDSIIPL